MSHKVYKARVLDIDKTGRATVLTSKGEFKYIKVDNRKINTGEEIDMTAIRSYRFPVMYKVTLAVAAVMIAILITSIVNPASPVQAQIARYYTVDINPSIELATDTNDIVVSAEGLNEDGKTLLDSINVENTPVEDAITQIVEQATEDGYISPEKENDIVIAVTDIQETNDEKGLDENETNENETQKEETAAKNNPVIDKLNDKINRTLNNLKVSARVSFLETRAEIRQKAEEAGISVGKYVILQEAQKQGLNVTIEDVKNGSIKKAIENAGGDFASIIKATKRDNNLGQKIKAANQERKQQKKPTAGNDSDENAISEDDNDNNNGNGKSNGKGKKNLPSKKKTGKNADADANPALNDSDNSEEDAGEQTKIQETIRTQEQISNSGEETNIRENNSIQNRQQTGIQEKNTGPQKSANGNNGKSQKNKKNGKNNSPF